MASGGEVRVGSDAGQRGSDGEFPFRDLDERNFCGRAQAMTVYSLVRPVHRRPPGGVLWLRLAFWFARTFRAGASGIRALSFIHFARWAVVPRIPDLGQPPEGIGHPLLLFESNYNGTFHQYIDAFAQILGPGMRRIWGTSYGFPGPVPVSPFQKYIRANEFAADHYYSAYPEASTTMVVSALALHEPHRMFHERAATLTPPEFAEEYRRFLTTIQDHL
jgi:hypothetical protein